MNPPFTQDIPVEATHIDRNGHVNNVVFVQWMQDVAVAHWRRLGGEAAPDADDTTWVARSHRIEYLHPAVAGDVIAAATWIDSVRRVRSIRRYEFRRRSDSRLLARGETDWVFIDAASGRPKTIPPQLLALMSADEKMEGGPEQDRDAPRLTR